MAQSHDLRQSGPGWRAGGSRRERCHRLDRQLWPDRAQHHWPSRRPPTKTKTSVLNETRIVLPMSSVRTVTYVPGCSGVRGTLVRLGLAESPPHPDRKNDPTSPRKRGEVTELAHVPIQLKAIVLQRISSGRRSLASQNIHSLGRGECARATLAVALCIIALGTGHRRRELYFQPRLGLFQGSQRRLVTKLRADRLWRGQSRERIALRCANGRFELRDIAGARSGQCICSGESEYRREKSRCHPGIGHREH